MHKRKKLNPCMYTSYFCFDRVADLFRDSRMQVSCKCITWHLHCGTYGEKTQGDTLEINIILCEQSEFTTSLHNSQPLKCHVEPYYFSFRFSNGKILGKIFINVILNIRKKSIFSYDWITLLQYILVSWYYCKKYLQYYV